MATPLENKGGGRGVTKKRLHTRGKIGILRPSHGSHEAATPPTKKRALFSDEK
jgi:hypothetical protein